MKNMLNTIFFIFICFPALAQQGSHKRIKLKNGSEYKGVILQNSNDTIRLLTEEDHILLFLTEEVSSIEAQKKSAYLYIASTESKKWYSTTNFLCDFDATDQLGFGVETFFGVKHHKYLQNGLGLGFKQDLGWYNYEPLTAHIALQNRVNLKPFGSTPFISYEPSYILSLNDGLLSDRYKKIGHSFEIGYRFYKPKKGRSFNLSAAVLRRMGEDFDSVYDFNTRTYSSNSLGWNPEYKMVLKFGYQL
jgi:hypothetical protein